MRSEKWRYLVRKFVVYDIPPDMAACFFNPIANPCGALI